MNRCTHKLGFLSNLACSEIIPANCILCGKSVVRKHPTPGLLAAGLFAAMGIPYLALVVLLFQYLPWLVLVTVLLFLGAYIRDTVKIQLSQHTEEDRANYKDASRKQLLGLFVLMVIMFILVIY